MKEIKSIIIKSEKSIMKIYNYENIYDCYKYEILVIKGIGENQRWHLGRAKDERK